MRDQVAVAGRTRRVRMHWSTAARLLLLVQVVGFAFMVAGTHGAFGPQPIPPTTTDFASFYAAGALANRGTPAAAYDAVAHRAAEFEAVSPGVEEKRFVNPPVFLLVCAALARLPYLVAFTAFEASTFIVWLVLGTRIAGGGAAAAIALAAIPSVWWAIGWGQNTFVSAALLSAGTLLIRRRPLLAGAAFGGLCFKPHLALLVPVALIAGCHWRAMAGAAFTGCTLCALSAVCFGFSAWRAFFVALTAHPAIAIGDGLVGHIDLGSATRLLGAPPSVGWIVQATATGVSAACVARLWWRARDCAALDSPCACRANAGLIAGTLAAAPFLLFYDLAIAGVSAAWIARSARQQGRQRRLIASFAMLACLDMMAFPAATMVHLALGALVSPALLWLIVRQDGNQVSTR